MKTDRIITVVEKYPPTAGVRSRTIDESGNIYHISTPDAWAKIRVGKSYRITLVKKSNQSTPSKTESKKLSPWLILFPWLGWSTNDSEGDKDDEGDEGYEVISSFEEVPSGIV